MNNMSSIVKTVLNILTAVIFALSITILIFNVIPSAFAKKGGLGGGKPPPPPPEECSDDFPGFAYQVEATRKSPEEIWLSSTDGCRRERVSVQSDGGRGIGPFHMAADRSKGVLLWKEDPGLTWQWIVHRQDFTVDTDGNLEMDLPVQLLPLAGEDVPAGDQLYYFNLDIWGDDSHDALYLAASRAQSFGPDQIRLSLH